MNKAKTFAFAVAILIGGAAAEVGVEVANPAPASADTKPIEGECLWVYTEDGEVNFRNVEFVVTNWRGKPVEWVTDTGTRYRKDRGRSWMNLIRPSAFVNGQRITGIWVDVGAC